MVRCALDDPAENQTRLVLLGGAAEFEWRLPQDDLRRVGLILHHLAAVPEHEHDHLTLDEESATDLEIRMTDAASWLPSER